jgi:hypothetical protein
MEIVMSTGDYIFPVGISAHHRTLSVASRSDLPPFAKLGAP